MHAAASALEGDSASPASRLEGLTAPTSAVGTMTSLWAGVLAVLSTVKRIIRAEIP